MGISPLHPPYFKLLDEVSGPEIIYFRSLDDHLIPQNQLEKVWGRNDPPFPMFFVVGRDRFDPKNI